MAIIPLNLKLSWYDPSQPTGVVTVVNENVNTATTVATQYSMQDVIDSVSGGIDLTNLTPETIVIGTPAGGPPVPGKFNMYDMTSTDDFYISGESLVGGTIGIHINNTSSSHVQLQVENTTGNFKIKNNSAAGYEYFVCNQTSRDVFVSTTVGMGTGNVAIGMAPSDTVTSKLQVVGIVEHADNAAAIAAGLTVGAIYRTGDLLKIVH